MEKKTEKHSGIGVGLAALLGSKMSDGACLQQLKDHGVITEKEFAELSIRLKV